MIIYYQKYLFVSILFSQKLGFQKTIRTIIESGYDIILIFARIIIFIV